jgi:hypothetical protein
VKKKKKKLSNVGCLLHLIPHAWKPQAHIVKDDVTSKTGVYMEFQTVNWGIDLSRN